jgi:alpha-L-fucosidase
MWDTETTDFSVMNTPFSRDVTAEIVEAFRSQWIAVGFYFSPDDFHFLHRQGTLISRRRPEAQPVNNPPLMSHNRAQVEELYSRFGPVDVFFIDGPEEGLLDLVWQLDPNTVVTRGAMKTPEITPSTREGLPDLTAVEPWEACFTMGTSWQYKPTNEFYRPGREWIELLVETRAKGGNMLLNIGPMPDGAIPVEQENILREIGLWLFVNGEAIYGVRPWVVANEGNVWFTRRKDTSTVYAVVTGEPWPWGERREIALSSVRAGAATRVSVLGQNDLVLEYQPDVAPETRWRQDGDRLWISAVRAQRLYNDRKWPNPVVLRITDAQPSSGGQP